MRTVSALTLFLALPACSLFDSGDTIPFTDVPNAEVLRLPEPGTAVFNDSVSWEAFWYDHTSRSDSDGNPVPPPEIDFSGRAAVAVFLGGGPSGCSNYVRLVRSISLDDGAATVQVERPLSVEGTCDMLIYPIHVVEFDNAEAVRFVGDVPG